MGQGLVLGQMNSLSAYRFSQTHQFAIWYIFAAFLGLMLFQSLWLRYSQVAKTVMSHSIFARVAAPADRRQFNAERGGHGLDCN